MDEEDEELEEDLEDTDIEDEDGEWMCAQCNGSGEGMHPGTICLTCHGIGIVKGFPDDEI